MGQPKISLVIYSLLLVSFMVGIIAIFMSQLNAGYERSFDNNSIAVYNQLDALANTTNSTQIAVNEIKEKTGVLDVIGGYFSSAYNALKTTLSSFQVFNVIQNQAMQDLSVGDPAGTQLLKTTIVTMFIVLVIIAIMISALLKWGM